MVPSSLSTDHFEEITKGAEIFASILPSFDRFKYELECWEKYWKKTDHSVGEISELYSQFEQNKTLQAWFPNIFVLSIILVTLPTSTCSCERSFSRMKRILSEKRTELSDESVRELMILGVYKEITLSYLEDPKKLDSLIIDFANLAPRRLELK